MTQIVEVKNRQTEKARNTAVKYKWYLSERHGMILNLLVPDYELHHILAVVEK